MGGVETGVHSNFHVGSYKPVFGLDRLIPIINQLQNVFNTTGTCPIQLPQIIVVGEQSSGKSSVLENICGFSCFPRGTKTCTRCPIVLQMIKKNRDDEQYRSLSAKLKATEWVEFPQLTDEKIVTDFNRVSHIINNEVNRRAAGENVIVKEQLILRIISPNVINLTLVDLPGLVSAPAEGQPEDIEQQIIDVVERYAKNPNSVILAVCAASNEIQNPKTIKFVKTIDPKGERTICVLTKLDLMDYGTDATDVLTGQIIKVKLGIVGVVNRSYDDTVRGVSIADSMENEAKFLIDNYPTIASHNGIPNLKVRLQRLLLEHIMKTLPMLQTRLTNMQM
ncbi:dynamin-1-like protein [Bradysia coprophila]|uniref:dynamin-1-like protein n=1 Tax=Bradysia coprophila TaxID=38358 RepID=UPI00187DD5C2|nr:dynamin-1-like protein [Bradysia coprophila]